MVTLWGKNRALIWSAKEVLPGGFCMHKPKSSLVHVVLAALACALVALPAMADSQARIVRLSDVQGSVEIDKNTGMGFEKGFLNLPITQGTRLRTRDTGRAEIEFEDGSTVRLAPNTMIEFSRLGLSDGGQRISEVNLTEGKAYVNWLGKSDDFTLNFSREKVQLSHGTHFRVETSTNKATFAVFKGDVDVAGPAGTVRVGKKKMVIFDVNDEDKYTLAKNFQEDPLDAWDKRSVEYHEQYAKGNSSPYGYGYSDLNYYGSFRNVGGYGMMWQPFFTGVGWDPFMDGAWAFYPGFGYMWASAYPWGWLPYRYGNWAFVSGFGWMWQPGGWNNWNAVPTYAGIAPPRFHPPARPGGTVATVVVGKRGQGVSSVAQSSLFVNRGSAGLGIPRGAVSNLSHVNGQVAKSGLVELRPTTSPSASGPNTGARGGLSPATGSAGMGRSTAAPSGHASAGGHTAHN